MVRVRERLRLRGPVAPGGSPEVQLQHLPRVVVHLQAALPPRPRPAGDAGVAHAVGRRQKEAAVDDGG